jgi:hypothetical protein
MRYTVTMAFGKPPQLTLRIEANGPGQARRIAAAEADSCGFGKPRRFDIREEQ